MEGNESVVKTKVCKHCHRELPVSEFYKCSANSDGLQHYCKECKSQISKEYYPRVKQRNETKSTKTFVPSSAKKVYHLECLASISNKDLIAELKARGFKGNLEYVYKIDM